MKPLISLRHPPRTFVGFWVAMALTLSFSSANAQDEADPAGWTFKLTPSWYATQHESNAIDVNLRSNQGQHTIWLGHYTRGNEFEQTRWGYEYNANFDWGQMVPSLQLATHGFLGGSLNFQVGGANYVLAGLGRTNLKDYYNLTFDPNDAYLIGIGSKAIENHAFNLFAVKDNRLQTGQKVVHGTWRWQKDTQHRWSVDISHKSGRLTPESPYLSGNAISITWDVDKHFVRLAKEQKVNFSDHDQQRISVGLRF